MSDIDWSKAPADATHFSPAFEDFVDLWAKTDGHTWMYRGMSSDAWHAGPQPDSKERYIERPWSGEGLPPIGLACEFKSEGHHADPEYQWCIYHGKMSCGGYIVEFHHHTSPSRTTCAPFDPKLTTFRPLRTEEQILLKERSKACDEMFGVLLKAGRPGNRSDICEALYDAGYRKQVQA